MEHVKEFLNLTLRKKQLEEELKQVTQGLEVLQGPLLNYFEQHGLSSVKADGHTVYLHRQVWASIDTGDPKALEAMENAGLGAFIRPQVNTQTLSSWVRELEEEGEKVPMSLKPYLKITEKYGLRTRKAS